MNQLFELVSIDVKPEKDDWYALSDGPSLRTDYPAGIPMGEFKNGEWVLVPKMFTHYLRPFTPPPSATEAAEKHIEDLYGPHARGQMVDKRKQSFLSGVSWQIAQGWVKLSELVEPITGIVITLMPNGRVFAYDSDHTLNGLKEVMKHHPESLCLNIPKPSPPNQ